MLAVAGLYALDLVLFAKKTPRIESEHLEHFQSVEFLDVGRMLRANKYAVDTILEVPEYAGWWVSDNYPKQDAKIAQQKGILLVLRDDELTKMDSSFVANKLYLVNNSGSKQCFDAQDSRLYIVMQAKNLIGNWQDIEYIPDSWCGNSYHTICLKNHEYWEFSSPIFKGRHKTKLRYQLEMQDSIIVSNEIDGFINTGQFLNKEKYFPRNIMDPYND